MLTANGGLAADTAPLRAWWHRFLHGPHASLLTHASLVLLTAALFTLLLRVPFWIACFPSAIVQHRIGVLLHEYIHGIPFRRYRSNLLVLSFFDGLLLTFGLTELFRGTHLAHHRWLNTERDPAFRAARDNRQAAIGPIAALEGIQHLIYLTQSLRGEHRYVVPSRIAIGACLSLGWIAVWILLGHATMPLKLLALVVYNTLVPVSLRGAVEHHDHPDNPGFANEYRVIIPLFNLNKHIHHHQEPRRPWYLLEYRTARPLWTWHYFTHWFKVYVTREFVLMRPFHRSPTRSGSAS